MIYKVYYQESLSEVPVREKTKTMFVKSDSVLNVRRSLKDRNLNIEYIGTVEGAYMDYEKENEDFKVLEL
ncbi:DNA-dependent RNA polymerase subunit epsilon [Bacillus testis]|uniref:DNA-dependent RNA polymerase subunit epsilon n=1 Tax=Bacillus testis TaxID=1622072 RepID=UPI00067F00B5|nr:RNA polymerase epsilon subunit [Bacillus testis]